MKKMVFVVIALLCFLLIRCEKKQVNDKTNDMSVDSKVNLESKQDLEKTNREQLDGNDGETALVNEQHDNKMIFQNREYVLSMELELKLKDIVCEKNNEKGFNSKELTVEDLQIIKYFGGFGESNSVHVLLMKDLIIDNKVTAVYTPFYYVTIYESSNSKSYMFKKFPELIFVINLNDNNIYSLFDACEKNMLTISDMNEIYSQYQMMIEEVANCD